MFLNYLGFLANSAMLLLSYFFLSAKNIVPVICVYLHIERGCNIRS